MMKFKTGDKIRYYPDLPHSREWVIEIEIMKVEEHPGKTYLSNIIKNSKFPTSIGLNNYQDDQLSKNATDLEQKSELVGSPMTTTTQKCTCPIHTLMNRGCQCGQIVSERKVSCSTV